MISNRRNEFALALPFLALNAVFPVLQKLFSTKLSELPLQIAITQTLLAVFSFCLNRRAWLVFPGPRDALLLCFWHSAMILFSLVSLQKQLLVQHTSLKLVFSLFLTLHDSSDCKERRVRNTVCKLTALVGACLLLSANKSHTRNALIAPLAFAASFCHNRFMLQFKQAVEVSNAASVTTLYTTFSGTLFCVVCLVLGTARESPRIFAQLTASYAACTFGMTALQLLLIKLTTLLVSKNSLFVYQNLLALKYVATAIAVAYYEHKITNISQIIAAALILLAYLAYR